MNKYIGKTCPFCKTEFKKGDNIVVCSACEMPHHKECWVENQSCTTFGCLGTIQNVDGTTTVATEEVKNANTVAQQMPTIYCTKCGTPNSSNYAFCTNCGNSLGVSGPTATQVYTQAQTYSQPYTQPNPQPYTQSYAQPTPKTYTQSYAQPNPQTYNQTYATSYSQANTQPNAQPANDDMCRLIGNNIGYYMSKFQGLKIKSEKISWNWAAFLFASYWFIYRKMYAYGLGVLAIALLGTLINLPFIQLLLFGGCIAIAIGLYGNYIYMQKIEKQAQQVKNVNEPYKTQFIMENGGVNANAVVFAVIGMMVLTGLFLA